MNRIEINLPVNNAVDLLGVMLIDNKNSVELDIAYDNTVVTEQEANEMAQEFFLDMLKDYITKDTNEEEN